MGILTQHITSEPEPVDRSARRRQVARCRSGLAEIITRCMQKNPAQRFASMDELVNALIAVYRGIAGPGMSTYMEAFPVGPSAAPARSRRRRRWAERGRVQPDDRGDVRADRTGSRRRSRSAAQSSQPIMQPGLYDPSASVVTVAQEGQHRPHHRDPRRAARRWWHRGVRRDEQQGQRRRHGRIRLRGHRDPDRLGSRRTTARSRDPEHGSAVGGRRASRWLRLGGDRRHCGSDGLGCDRAPRRLRLGQRDDADSAHRRRRRDRRERGKASTSLESGVPVLNGIVAVRPRRAAHDHGPGEGLQGQDGHRRRYARPREGRARAGEVTTIPPHQCSAATTNTHNGSNTTHHPPPGVDCTNTVRQHDPERAASSTAKHHPDDATPGCDLD